MGSKFFIYGDGRWRELDTESGTLAGWGRATFVYQAGGRLEVARRRSVLRALRALAGGRGRAARDGLQLSKQMPYPENGVTHWLQSPKPHWQCQSHHTHIVQTCIQCDNNSKFDQLRREPQCTVGVQCVPTAEAAVQVTQESQAAAAAQPCPRTAPSDEVEVITPRSQTLPHRNKRGQYTKKKPDFAKRDKEAKYFPKSSRKAIEQSTNTTKPSPAPIRVADNSRSSRSRRKDSSSSELDNDKSNAVKELMIEEVDVQLLRRFLKKNSFGVELKRFDNDEEYKRRVFYSINPMVLVERCARIKRMLREERGAAARPPLTRFMSGLGLRAAGGGASSTRARAPHRVGDDKENEAERGAARAPHARPAKVLREDNVTFNRAKTGRVLRPPPAKRPRRSPPSPQRPQPVIDVRDGSSEGSSSSDGCGGHHANRSRNTEKKKDESETPRTVESSSERIISNKREGGKRQPAGAGGGRDLTKKNREYSVQEDSAIVSWLRQGGRARLVNGNRLWRELQHEHATRTGTVRSWHSLRNRYLRYILPALSQFTSQQEAARLRAAASTGELKSRKQSRENSLLAVPPVRSAWSRRRVAAPPASPADSPEPAPRASTPKPAESRRAAPAPTPSYSALLRRYGSAPTSSSEEFQSVEAATERSLRLRSRTSPAHGRTLRASPAKRRLYNPKVGA